MEQVKSKTIRRKRRGGVRQWPLHLMLIPAIVSLFIFQYIPMGGVVIAFQKFIPAKGLFGNQKWIGFENFEFMFGLSKFWSLLRNTLYISTSKIILNLFMAVGASLLLNEIRISFIKRSVQTMIYLPHFISWVILGSIFQDILSPSSGIVNTVIKALGGEAVYFLGNEKIFPWTVILTDVWKNFGYNTIVYLAAISNIDPTLYEASAVDGAKRYQNVLHITLPELRSIIVLLSTLSLGSILNAGTEQILTMYNPSVYSTGDIIDTYVYRMAMQDAQYSLSTAVGLFKSFISMFLIIASYWMARKFANYTIF